MIVYELQHKYPLEILLDISGLKKSTYYYTLDKLDKDTKNDDIVNTIIDIFYTYKAHHGYRRIALELINRGFKVNHKKVKRLISKMGLYALTPKAKYKSYKGDMNGMVKNLLLDKVIDEVKHKIYYEKNFETEACNEIGFADVS